MNAVTIGYFLAEEHWGKGGVPTLVKCMFEEIDINGIQAEVKPATRYQKSPFRK